MLVTHCLNKTTRMEQNIGYSTAENHGGIIYLSMEKKTVFLHFVRLNIFLNFSMFIYLFIYLIF